MHNTFEISFTQSHHGFIDFFVPEGLAEAQRRRVFQKFEILKPW